jgi:hypothetical protein
MKYKDGIGELGNVNDPKCTGYIPNPNFLHAPAYGVHWLPVIWFLAVLHLIDLVACFTPGLDREGTEVIKGATPELDGFGIGHVWNI